MANIYGHLQSTINSIKKKTVAITATISDEGEPTERRALDVNVVRQTLKAVITEDDLVDGVITLSEPVSYFEIINKNNTDGLEFVINGITITLDKKDVDAKGLPLIYSFGDDFAPFTEVVINGTGLSFNAIVKG